MIRIWKVCACSLNIQTLDRSEWKMSSALCKISGVDENGRGRNFNATLQKDSGFRRNWSCIYAVMISLQCNLSRGCEPREIKVGSYWRRTYWRFTEITSSLLVRSYVLPVDRKILSLPMCSYHCDIIVMFYDIRMIPHCDIARVRVTKTRLDYDINTRAAMNI